MPDDEKLNIDDGSPADPKERVVTVCGSPLRKKPGQFCTQRCVVGRNRCRLHGGLTLKGDEAGMFKHGLHSRSMPKHLRADFQKLLNDPALLEGKSEIAVLQVRYTQLLKRLETNESGEAWRLHLDLISEAKGAFEVGDTETAERIITKLHDAISEKVNDERAWHELVLATDMISKVTEREWKRLIANRTVATIEQVRAVVASISNAVLLYVTDTDQRRAIAEHVNRLRVIEPIDPSPTDDRG